MGRRQSAIRSSAWSSQEWLCALRFFYGCHIRRVADEVLARPEVNDLIFDHEEVQRSG